MKKKSKGTTQLKKEIDDKLTFTLESVIPISQMERKKYVADCTFFYSTIFKKQLEYLRGEQLIELSKIGRTEELNNIFRANINCLNLIDAFFEKMENEHFGNLSEIRNSLESNDDFINQLKKNYD